MGIECSACGEEIVEGAIRAGVAVCGPCAREWDRELPRYDTMSLQDLDFEGWAAATNTNPHGQEGGY